MPAVRTPPAPSVRASRSDDPAIAVVVSWTGPYTLEEAKVQSRKVQGLYMVWGKAANAPRAAPNRLQYVGISDAKAGIVTRINSHAADHKPFCQPGNKWWIGVVVAPQEIDENNRRAPLDAAEWMLVPFFQPLANQQKTKSEPRYRSYLINQWYRPEAPHLRYEKLTFPIMKHIPAVVAWSPDSESLRSVPSLPLVKRKARQATPANATKKPHARR